MVFCWFIFTRPSCLVESSLFQIVDIWRSGWIWVLWSFLITHSKMHNKLKLCCVLNPVTGSKASIFWGKKKLYVYIYIHKKTQSSNYSWEKAILNLWFISLRTLFSHLWFGADQEKLSHSRAKQNTAQQHPQNPERSPCQSSQATLATDEVTSSLLDRCFCECTHVSIHSRMREANPRYVGVCAWKLHEKKNHEEQKVERERASFVPYAF